MSDSQKKLHDVLRGYLPGANAPPTVDKGEECDPNDWRRPLEFFVTPFPDQWETLTEPDVLKCSDQGIEAGWPNGNAPFTSAEVWSAIEKWCDAQEISASI